MRANGHYSDEYKVLSGVPQGSVLGPLLFTVHISDLHFLIKTNIIFYADDTKIYCNPCLEHHNLLDDLKTLEKWISEWQLTLNPDKCTVLHIGPNNPNIPYSLNGTTVKAVSEQKDLGVIISNHLKWEAHISSVVKRTNSFVYLIQKAFSDRSIPMISKIYKTYIRPKLEFAHSVWSPYLVKDIEILERVQRRVTKLPPEIRNLSYEERLLRYDITTLKARRERGDLIETYKILNHHYSPALQLDIFNLNTSQQLRGHTKKLDKERCSKLIRKNFLTNRVVYQWNALQESTVSAPSKNAFKNRLDRDLERARLNFVHYM